MADALVCISWSNSFEIVYMHNKWLIFNAPIGHHGSIYGPPHGNMHFKSQDVRRALRESHFARVTLMMKIMALHMSGIKFDHSNITTT